MKVLTLILTPLALVWPFLFYMIVLRFEPDWHVGLMLGYLPFGITIALLTANIILFIRSLKNNPSMLIYPLVCSSFLAAGAVGRFLSIIKKI